MNDVNKIEGGVGEPERKKPASFAELEQKSQVTAEELKETLRDYVEGGAPILAGVVISIMERTELSPQDLQELKQIAQTGVEKQGGDDSEVPYRHRAANRDKREYGKVVQYINFKE